MRLLQCLSKILHLSRSRVDPGGLHIAVLLDDALLVGVEVALRHGRLEVAEARWALAPAVSMQIAVVAHPLGSIDARDSHRRHDLAVPDELLMSWRDVALVPVPEMADMIFVFGAPRRTEDARYVVQPREDDVAAASAALVKPAVLPLPDEHPAGVDNTLAHRAHGLGNGHPGRLVVADGELDPGRRRGAGPDDSYRSMAALVADVLVKACSFAVSLDEQYMVCQCR